MASSLDRLVGNLEKEQFRNMAQFYQGEKLNLLLRKGVYPYDYMDRLERLDETRLPPSSPSILNLTIPISAQLTTSMHRRYGRRLI